MAVGAALAGFRPVVEFQFMDFIASAFNMVTNFAAKSRYRAGAAVPIVLRGPSGAGVRAGPFHSQSLEAHFAHTPGIKVVAPATAPDAAGLLRAAIRDDDPVLFLEHKRLYRSLRVPDDEFDRAPEVVPLGKSGDSAGRGRIHHRLLRGGGVGGAGGGGNTGCRGRSRRRCWTCAALVPLDREAVFDSVRRTSRLLVLHEDNLTGGFGGEIAALVGEHLFGELDAPVTRIAAADTPVPYAAELEDAVLPNATPGRRSRSPPGAVLSQACRSSGPHREKPT